MAEDEIKEEPEVTTEEEVVEDPAPETEEPEQEKPKKSKKSSVKKLTPHLKKLVSSKKRKIIIIIAAVLVVLGALTAIPVTRYAIAGLVLKKDVSITVLDAKTKRPVSDAVVSLGSVNAKSDSKGIAHLKSVRVGEYSLKITKQYYSDSTTAYTVPVFSAPATTTTDLTATGRQVSILVTNKISGDPIEDVTIVSSGTSATTGSDGTSVIILPTKQDTQTAVISKSGYNSLSVVINVNDVTAKNNYQLAPSGSIYYLSKITGTINVMKSDLDGANAKVAVQGTGKESDTQTVLLSARDWQYSMLLAKRDSDQDKLYLINSSDDSLTTVDQGDATFSLVGWSGHTFVYIVYRNTTNYWDNKREALKSYNADTKKLTTIYETSGAGTAYYDYQYELLSNVYILDNEIVYLKSWEMGSNSIDTTKNASLISVDPTMSVKKTIKDFPNTYNASVSAKLYSPQSLYIRTQNYPSDAVFYDYEDSNIKVVTNVTDDTFDNAYPTYLISPNGNKTFWTDPRDGKNTLLIGDKNAGSSTQIATLSDYSAYGWYGDNYILLTKNGSELYIASADKPLSSTNQPLFITNYHKPQVSYPGYGYGYGGQ